MLFTDFAGKNQRPGFSISATLAGTGPNSKFFLKNPDFHQDRYYYHQIIQLWREFLPHSKKVPERLLMKNRGVKREKRVIFFVNSA